VINENLSDDEIVLVPFFLTESYHVAYLEALIKKYRLNGIKTQKELDYNLSFGRYFWYVVSRKYGKGGVIWISKNPERWQIDGLREDFKVHKFPEKKDWSERTLGLATAWFLKHHPGQILYAVMNEKNKPGIKLLERCGFVLRLNMKIPQGNYLAFAKGEK
jgi:hypothetical protein